ncbi:MAG: hypothetical protein AABY32_03875 [Nanoarchaeota archaeon]
MKNNLIDWAIGNNDTVSFDNLINNGSQPSEDSLNIAVKKDNLYMVNKLLEKFPNSFDRYDVKGVSLYIAEVRKNKEIADRLKSYLDSLPKKHTFSSIILDEFGDLIKKTVPKPQETIGFSIFESIGIVDHNHIYTENDSNNIVTEEITPVTTNKVKRENFDVSKVKEKEQVKSDRIKDRIDSIEY